MVDKLDQYDLLIEQSNGKGPVYNSSIGLNLDKRLDSYENNLKMAT